MRFELSYTFLNERGNRVVRFEEIEAENMEEALRKAQEIAAENNGTVGVVEEI